MLMVVTYAILIFADPVNHPQLTEDLIRKIDFGLIIFLAVEYGFRLWKAKEKKKFVLANWFDLIAMIPFDHYFYLFRFMRVIRLVRILRASPFLWGVMNSRSMRRIFSIATLIMLWSSVGIYLLETGVNKNITHFGDAVWWSIVTTTTVGYGDISPVTAGGRVIAAFLMITGIGLLGALTANFANHWAEFFEAGAQTEENRLRNELKRSMINSIHNLESLSEAEFQTMLDTLQFLHNKKSAEKT
jgi:voltage-gated potassium channel